MAGPTLTLNAPGKIGAAYTFPDGFDIRGDGYASRLEGASVDGRRGRIMRSFGARGDVASVMISGRLKEATLAALRTALDDLAEAVGDDAVLWLQYDADGTASYKRERPVRLANLAISPAAGGFIGVSLTFAAEDTWRDVGNTPQTTTHLCTVTSEEWAWIVDYGGSASQFGKVKLTASGGIWPASGNGTLTWRGRNLLYNSGLDEDDGAGFPKGWTGLGGSPTWEKHFGHFGDRCMKIYGGNVDRFSTASGYYVPIDNTLEYTFSVYLYVPEGAANMVIWIRWRTAAGGIAGSDTTFGLGIPAGTGWVRQNVTGSAPNATAKYAEVRVSGDPTMPTTEYVYAADFQLEVGTSATPYHDTNDPRYKHRTVTVATAIRPTPAYKTSSAMDMMLDFEAGEVTLQTGTKPPNMVPVNAIWDGTVFELLPGRNHFDIALPGNEIIVEHMHPNRYLV